MKSYINGIIKVVTTGALILVIYEQDKTIQRMKTVENANKDSLVLQTKLQQQELLDYESALMLLDQKDTTASNKFLNILEKEVGNKYN